MSDWMKHKLESRLPGQRIEKQRHYFPTKVHIIKSMVFPVVMYGCESWTAQRKLSAEELMLLNCAVGEDS